MIGRRDSMGDIDIDIFLFGIWVGRSWDGYI